MLEVGTVLDIAMMKSVVYEDFSGNAFRGDMPRFSVFLSRD